MGYHTSLTNPQPLLKGLAMNRNYAIIIDDRGNMIGNATKERHGKYYNGKLGLKEFQCPGDLLSAWALKETGHKAKTIFVHEPLWLMGTIIAV